MLNDPELRDVQTLIFDEFHERHLYGDITVARALDLQENSRPDLQIIVMSATLESRALEIYLEPCSVLISEGRMFPVEMEYMPQPRGGKLPPVWDLAADAFARFVREETAGDVLVFMPGSFEIQRSINAIAIVGTRARIEVTNGNRAQTSGYRPNGAILFLAATGDRKEGSLCRRSRRGVSLSCAEFGKALTMTGMADVSRAR